MKTLQTTRPFLNQVKTNNRSNWDIKRRYFKT